MLMKSDKIDDDDDIDIETDGVSVHARHEATTKERQKNLGFTCALRGASACHLYIYAYN